MNKKNTRKGFTIVELVIVIAVIAILATVLVPTFGNIIEKANASKLLQAVKNEHTNYTTKYASSADYKDSVVIKYEDKFYEFKDGTLVVDANNKPEEKGEPEDGIYYDAASDTLLHKFVAQSGEGADATKCATCTKTQAEGDHSNKVTE